MTKGNNKGGKANSRTGHSGSGTFISQNPQLNVLRTPAPVPPRQGMSASQALTLAARHQEAGRLAEAEALLGQVLAAEPGNAQAWHLRGMVALSRGRPEMAVDFVGRAINCDGKVALFYANLTEINRQLKRLDAAIDCGRKAVALDPAFVLAHRNLGVALFDKGNLDEAEACQRAALKIKPDFAPSLNNLGSIFHARKDDEAALGFYRRAMAANPDYAEAANNAAVSLLQLGRASEALGLLESLLARRPSYAAALSNKGSVLLDLGRETEALDYFHAAAKLRPDYPEAQIGLAKALSQSQLLAQAEAAARRAVELAPALAEAHTALGAILAARGATEEAQRAFARALELDPGHESAKSGLGDLMAQMGRLTEAEDIFRMAVHSGNPRPGDLFRLVRLKKARPGDPEIELLERAAATARNENDVILLHFALGKAYDDTGDAQKAFPQFVEGCRLKRRRIQYDAGMTARYFERVREIFSEEFMRRHAGAGHLSEQPVFVLGMPRSGTTLTEQIIASHPDAHGAGEIMDLVDAAGSWLIGPASFPENVSGMTGADLKALGQKYATGLAARQPAARRITDKLPVNFMHMGLIHLILPQAKVIHVSRHPLDTCISCFTQLFANGTQRHTYDLRELGRYYRNYHDLMNHWRRTLPEGAFLEVRYEDLIADMETQARRLIAWCGLDWDDRCLAFHKTERDVRTASVAQVRQPVYKSSLARWKKYEAFLGPLIEELGDILPHE